MRGSRAEEKKRDDIHLKMICEGENTEDSRRIVKEPSVCGRKETERIIQQNSTL